MTKQQDNKHQTFVFQVDIMVESSHHATALAKLIAGLNRGEWPDYRITSGIQLGRLIEQRSQMAEAQTPIPITPPKEKEKAKETSSAQAEFPGLEQLRSLMKSNTLIRLIVNRGLGIKLNIPCRIINIDDHQNILTVYHVDEKQVYTFRFTEIEDFSG
ncbi:hypothetical protein [Paenibacillus sp. PL2-23]|uniref:hypothetical protein n=1 Tax=Paenibacillus sp. PL2-23 TaxID=2100729 RepID=UPI0030F918F2